MTKYERHPIGACYPDLNSEEFELLVARVKSGEKMPPAQLFEGKILDGWHYCKACSQVGVEPDTEVVTPDDPVTFVIRRNEGRRQLTTGQKAIIANEIANVVKGGAGGFTMKSDRPQGPIDQTQAAQAMGVSPRTVKRASYVKSYGGPEVNGALSRGEINAKKAEEIAHLPKDQQGAAVRQATAKKPRPVKKKSSKGHGRVFYWEQWSKANPAQVTRINEPSIYPEGEKVPVGDDSPGSDEKWVRHAIEELRKNEPLIPTMGKRQLEELIYPFTQAIQTYVINRMKRPRPEGELAKGFWDWAQHAAKKMLCRRNFCDYCATQEANKKMDTTGKVRPVGKKSSFEQRFRPLWNPDKLGKFQYGELPQVKDRWVMEFDKYFQQRALRAQPENNGNLKTVS
jgi:hypothetical protein